MVVEPAWAGVVVSFLVGLSGLVLGIFNFMVAVESPKVKSCGKSPKMCTEEQVWNLLGLTCGD